MDRRTARSSGHCLLIPHRDVLPVQVAIVSLMAARRVTDNQNAREGDRWQQP
jgi:hypothetical protein